MQFPASLRRPATPDPFVSSLRHSIHARTYNTANDVQLLRPHATQTRCAPTGNGVSGSGFEATLLSGPQT